MMSQNAVRCWPPLRPSSARLAKTVTYEGVTAVSEFGANYLFVRDLAAAAGLTAFSIVIAPFDCRLISRWQHEAPDSPVPNHA